MKAKDININEYLQSPVLLHLEKLTGIAPADVPIDDEKVYGLLTSSAGLGATSEEIECRTGTLGIPDLESPFMQNALCLAKVNSFDDLVKVFGLASGVGTWNNNAENLLRSGQCTLSETIAHREDVREHDILDWYIESHKKIEYLQPKAHAISKINISARILWFKLYHPLAFYAVSFQTLDSEMRKHIEEKFSVDDLLLKLSQIRKEYCCRGFDFLPVELGKSLAVDYKIENGKLRLPYISIDGIGSKFANRLEQKAKSKECYTSYRDLRAKIGLNNVAIDALEQAGLLSGMSTGTKL